MFYYIKLVLLYIGAGIEQNNQLKSTVDLQFPLLFIQGFPLFSLLQDRLGEKKKDDSNKGGEQRYSKTQKLSLAQK